MLDIAASITPNKCDKQRVREEIICLPMTNGYPPKSFTMTVLKRLVLFGNMMSKEQNVYTDTSVDGWTTFVRLEPGSARRLVSQTKELFLLQR